MQHMAYESTFGKRWCNLSRIRNHSRDAVIQYRVSTLQSELRTRLLKIFFKFHKTLHKRYDASLKKSSSYQELWAIAVDTARPVCTQKLPSHCLCTAPVSHPLLQMLSPLPQLQLCSSPRCSFIPPLSLHNEIKQISWKKYFENGQSTRKTQYGSWWC